MSDSDGSDPGYPRATSRVSMGVRNLRGDERQTLARYDDGELSDNDEEILQDEAYRGRRPEVRRRNFSSAHHGAFSFDGPLGGSLRGLPVSSEPPASPSGDIAIEESPLLDSQLEQKWQPTMEQLMEQQPKRHEQPADQPGEQKGGGSGKAARRAAGKAAGATATT